MMLINGDEIRVMLVSRFLFESWTNMKKTYEHISFLKGIII